MAVRSGSQRADGGEYGADDAMPVTDARTSDLEVVVSAEGSRVGALLEALSDEDWRVRRSAATSIATEDHTVTTGPLLERLASEDAGERNAAIKALVRIGRPAVPAVAARLRDTDPDIRNFAALALGLIGDPDASGALVEALRAEVDPNVTYMIVEALGRIGDPESVSDVMALLDRDDWLKAPAIEALGSMDCAESVTALLDLVGDEAVGGIAANALARIGDHRAVPVLMLAAGSTRGFACRTYLAALHRLLDSPRQTGAILSSKLRALLRPEQAHALREAVAATLAEDGVGEDVLGVALWLDDPTLLEPVLHALDDVALHALGLRFVTRHFASLPLAERGVVASGLSAHGLQVLLEAAAVAGTRDDVVWAAGLLDDPNPVVAATAARAVGRLGEAADARLLVPLLTHRLSDVAEAARTALARLGLSSVAGELWDLAAEGTPEGRIAVAAVLSSADSGDIPGLTDVLTRLAGDEDARVRAAVARRACGPLGLGDDDRCAELAKDPDPTVRRAAVVALSRRMDAKASALLLEAAEDESPAVRVSAIEALASGMHDGLDPGVLRRALEDSDPRIVLVGLAAVERTGMAPDSAVLERLLGDPDPELRSSALTALGRAEPQEARAVACGAAYDPDWRVREAALGVLGTVPSDDARVVARHALEDEDVSVRRAAVAVSGRILGEEATGKLVALLRDAHVGADAENALLQAACGDPGSVFDVVRSAPREERRALLRVAAASGHLPGLLGFASSADAEERFYGLIGLADSPWEVLERLPSEVGDGADRSTAEVALSLRVAAARGRAERA